MEDLSAVRSAASSQPRRKPVHRCRRWPTHRRCRRHTSTLTLALVAVTLLSLLSFRDEAFVHASDDYYAAQVDDAGDNADEEVAGDDGNAATDDNSAVSYDDKYSSSSSSSSYEIEQKQYQNTDDDTFHWNSNIGFDGVSVMPLSCINYNSGHMIKFQLFDSANSYQCHFSEISTFVVSISHYMRAYFNYQAIKEGSDFMLPSDAAYLECTPLQFNGAYLYAKVGCMERETFTSTKLQLHLYTDQHCSQQYQDGESARRHAKRGYDLGGYRISSKVSFKPEFYSCLTCSPEEISQTFNKVNSNWYDDDSISTYGKNSNSYSANDDGGGRRLAAVALIEDLKENQIEVHNIEAEQAYHDTFWREYDEVQRHLYNNNYYDIGDWNMCQRIYKYGVWCDEECRALDFFRTDLWSVSDIFLLSIMCTFLTAMILLVIAKRLKAQQKARMYGEDQSIPGLPPCAMAIIFFVIMAVIVILAEFKFINETLVFAVVTCILLFIYMLKLTLFEHRKPVLLAAPRHDMFDNPLDDHLFS